MDIEFTNRQILAMLEKAGLPLEAATAFERMYRSYRGGATGCVPWSEISGLERGDLIDVEDLNGPDLREVGRGCLDKVVWIVLNGGLGTSMYMDRAKSLVQVKGAHTFLDLLCTHVIELRRKWGAPVPLLFMNSFATREDTLAAIAPHRVSVCDRRGRSFPADFVQHRFPRIREADGLPLGDGADRSSWAPPGHGDLFLALRTSGVLGALLGAGIRWAFVSNADNLGASIHLGILGFLASESRDFLMEVTAKTSADVKGGTLVRHDGRLMLLELAQVSDDHRADFQDVSRFPVFNTNSLWLDLEAVDDGLSRGALELPLIVNRKTADGVPVVQLETAMGAAISSFPRSAGVLVPRARFAPVKTTDDLLVRRSDAYVRGGESPLVPNPERPAVMGPPRVRLDPRFFASVAALDRRIPEPPSLLQARSLEVVGDVWFGGGVTVIGDVRVDAGSASRCHIEDGAVLSG